MGRDVMTGAESVLFRFDAGLELGGGHAMRCLGLADALLEGGATPTFAVRRSTLETLPSLADGKAEIMELSQSEDLSTVSFSKQPETDWLVVDRPGWGKQDAQMARRVVSAVAVISDAPDQSLDCDILIDTTAGRDAGEYDGLVPTGCSVLIGPAYALLRPDFAALRRRSISARKGRSQPSRILIGFGATDPHGATLMALDAVKKAAPDALVDIVLGASAPCLDEVRKRAAASNVSMALHVDTPDVATLMARADFAIGAAGITSWERCSVGLPAIIVTQADNQLPNAASLERNGAANILGATDAVSVDDIAAAIGRMLRAPDQWHNMVDSAAAMCDGLGARRVAQVMFPEFARDGAPVTLRPASLKDVEILFEWQCHPDTRRYFRTPHPPSRCTHENWLTEKLADPGCVFGIVEHDRTPCGVIRFDATDGSDRTGRTDIDPYEVSILVAPDRWGLGIGSAALRIGRRLLPFATLRASVDAENSASQRLFANAGYCHDGKDYVLSGGSAATF